MRIDHVAWGRLFARTAASGRTLQARLREMVAAAVNEGWLTPDHPLPSSRELAETLAIARNTVVLAYQQLVDEGVLEARERSGYFVRPEARSRRIEPAPAPDEPDAAPAWQRLACDPPGGPAQSHQAARLAELSLSFPLRPV